MTEPMSSECEHCAAGGVDENGSLRVPPTFELYSQAKPVGAWAHELVRNLRVCSACGDVWRLKHYRYEDFTELSRLDTEIDLLIDPNIDSNEALAGIFAHDPNVAAHAAAYLRAAPYDPDVAMDGLLGRVPPPPVEWLILVLEREQTPTQPRPPREIDLSRFLQDLRFERDGSGESHFSRNSVLRSQLFRLARALQQSPLFSVPNDILERLRRLGDPSERLLAVATGFRRYATGEGFAPDWPLGALTSELAHLARKREPLSREACEALVAAIEQLGAAGVRSSSTYDILNDWMTRVPTDLADRLRAAQRSISTYL